MATFKCKMLTRDGQRLEKTLIARTKPSLKEHLEREGYFVVDIQRADGVGSLIKGGMPGNRVGLKDLMAFSQEFSILIKAGLPIISALNVIIEKRGSEEFARVLTEVRNDISSGSSLSDAFGKHSHLFSGLYISSLKAGERSGNIPSSLARYIGYIKKVLEIRRKMVTASVYPIILTGVSIFVILFLMIYVVPSFTGTYLEAGTELPRLTVFLVQTSHLLRDYFMVLLLIVAIMLLGYRVYAGSEKGRIAVDRAKLGVPFLVALFVEYSLSRMSRTLATVLQGGMPLLDSLRVSTGTLDNQFLKRKLERAAEEIEKGAGFSEAVSNTKTFPRLAMSMLEAGEKSGALDQVLNDIADFYDNEIDARLSILTSSVEPALMVVMGLLIGFIVLAMYMPIFQMAGTIR
ncbi:MAG: type II secretion system F family protein [Desulfobacterales bacterium]|nr:type II secretion system F family protein [Desulfobacterales bacterium]